MSEKLDGIRAYWTGKELLFRSGRPVHAPRWFIQKLPPFAVDGELWSKRGDFEHISSIVRDKEPSSEWKKIGYYIFDVPEAKGGLLKRLETLKPFCNDIVHLIPQKRISSKKALQNYLKKVEAKGGEGVVVRDQKAPYIPKRTAKALKVKSFLDDECEVVGYKKGKGKFAEKVGSLICRWRGKSIKIGSGLTNELRIHPPRIGTLVTFKYKGLSRYGNPRFPVFLRVRR